MPIIQNGKVLSDAALKQIKKVEIKSNPSVVAAKKTDGTIVKKYLYKFYLNGEEVEMNDKLYENINNIIKSL